MDDHCHALEKIVESGVAGEVYNIGGNNEQMNIDVVRAICDFIDERLGLTNNNSVCNLIIFVKDRPGHDLRYVKQGVW